MTQYYIVNDVTLVRDIQLYEHCNMIRYYIINDVMQVADTGT